jgi:hypothetical protein
MPDTTTTPGGVEDAVVEAARGGDEAAFAELVGRYRRELHVHCYRLLGSFEEAEDLGGGRIAEITTFDATLFPEFGLPPTL